jgi:DNA-binding CsgD family transcriptional regulator
MATHDRIVRITSSKREGGNEAPSTLGLADGLESLVAELGLSYYLFLELPRGDRTTFADNLVATNWPDPLQAFYRRNDLFFCSNMITAFRRTIIPVSMGVEAFGCAAANYDNSEVEAIVRGVSAQNSFGFTLHDVDMGVFALILSGARSPLLELERAFAVRKATELLDGIDSPNQSVTAPSERLSRRELECLRWTAAGKSSDEIGIILNLSGHTVVGYLKTAMKKLDSVNRMQAVARAYRYRLI